METAIKKCISLTFILLLSILLSGLVIPQKNSADWETTETDSELWVSFSKKYGQLEVGGNYAGVEFHHSRPLPSRISFYYPVANSIDLSTDYWKRDESLPFTVRIQTGGRTDTIETEPAGYRYTPASAEFFVEKPEYHLSVSYRFCDDLPAMVFELRLKNRSGQERDFSVKTALRTVLRTCQTYAFKNDAFIKYQDERQTFLARFDDPDTDSVLVFICNSGAFPMGASARDTGWTFTGNPAAEFEYRKSIPPEEDMTITQVIGCCRQPEKDSVLQKVRKSWKASAEKNAERISQYAFHQSHFNSGETKLQQTFHWAKAVLAANRHYLNGRIVPMPCPAEYNFFFTHDALLTDLGAVLFDTGRVRADLFYLKSLTGPDSVLPHAYYWRDGSYRTEFCGADNWNHFWFMILSNLYLQYSGDTATVRAVYPVLKKSMEMVMRNKQPDNLMYAFRPDWWDIGHLYGARAYVTILMIKSLQDFAAIEQSLNISGRQAEYLALSRQMRRSLVSRLWDENSGYLLNMLDSAAVDRHYYSGSLLAAVFNLLEPPRLERLLTTAREKLLDPELGIRNAMPPDFHLLTERYHFKEGEAGNPYIYANGGVWPHGTAWYILGLLSAGEPDQARNALVKYLTLNGIRNSPGGQPSFYEYRNADPKSPDYGKIDKPTFLWAGGWYLNALYHLGGIRENSWNIFFSPDLPAGFEDVSYDIFFKGHKMNVQWEGRGNLLSGIHLDGQPLQSAVLFTTGDSLRLVRGPVTEPYLLDAGCRVESVAYSSAEKQFRVTVRGLPGRQTELRIACREPAASVQTENIENGRLVPPEIRELGTVSVYRFKLSAPRATVSFYFR